MSNADHRWVPWSETCETWRTTWAPRWTIIINRANYRDNQVHKQNDQLDRINKKAESDKMRVKQANDKAQALLK